MNTADSLAQIMPLSKALLKDDVIDRLILIARGVDVARHVARSDA
jgi:hypothetical protein